MDQIIRTRSISGLLCILGLFSAALPAAVRGDYKPPNGFNGLDWGAPLAKLGKIMLARANVALDSKGAYETENEDQYVEGRGSFAVAEYYRVPDSNPWATSLVALHSATYLFCDEWLGRSVRTDVKERLQLCGARVFYRSETGAQLAAKAAGFESNHDRVLRHLIAEFGPYDGQRLRKGEVSAGPVVDSGTGEPAAALSSTPPTLAGLEQGVTRYRWCGMHAITGVVLPECDTTITLLFNRETGWGMVLFATGVVYKYAQARHATKDENNELYMALISRDPGRPTRRNANTCLRTTGSLVCEGKLEQMPESERRRFDP